MCERKLPLSLQERKAEYNRKVQEKLENETDVKERGKGREEEGEKTKAKIVLNIFHFREI